MGIFLAVLAWQLAELQAVTTLLPLAAASHCVGSDTTDSEFSRFPLVTS